MNIKVEELEGHMAKITVELEPESLERAADAVYRKQRNSINVPGFRKGKAPRVLIEKMYGESVFFNDAANDLISQEYPNVYDECDLDIVSAPEIDIIQLEKGKTFIFTAEVATRPPVELGKYMGVTVTRADVEVTEQDLADEIKRTMSQNSRTVDITDRPVKEDDRVNIDYSGKVDGVAFDGGTAKDTFLKIGSGQFIPGFEEQLIGHNIGEEFDIDVTFPEEYHSKELAGKDAVFTVKINQIQMEEVPELDEEYVSNTTEYDTVDEYKAHLKETILERKQRAAKRQKEEEAIEKIVASSKMDVPDAMIETQIDSMIRDFERNLSMQGMNLNMYASMTGMSPETMRTQMREDAEKQVRTSLVLEAIVKAENIEATDEDVQKEFEEMSKMYGIDSEEMMKNITDSEKKRMKKNIAVEKAVSLIGDNVKERAKSKKKDEAASDDDAPAEKPKRTRKKKEE